MSEYEIRPLMGLQFVVRTADGAIIPPDPRNMDYQAYLAWVAQGNTATVYVPPALNEPTG